MIEGREEIAAAISELRDELDRIVGDDPGAGPGAAALDERVRRMHATKGMTADHAPVVRPGRLAPARLLAKRGIAKALRWYVERLAVDVRAFAEATSGTVAELAARSAHAEARQADVERLVAALRDRVARLERSAASRPQAAAPPARGAQPEPAPAAAVPSPRTAGTADAAHPFDYFAFEALMRGSREEIADRQRRYLPLFEGRGRVLDVGCGRGEFLALLREAGVGARGIDVDADMVAQCRAEGLDVEQAEAVGHLSGLEAGSLDGIFAAQVVEHLEPRDLVAFLAAARAALASDGVLVLETINPASLSALRNYFADLTHAQPLVAETLAFLVESAGFREARVELTSPLPDDARLTHVPYGDTVPEEALTTSRRNVDLLNALLFAPQDYAVIARG